MASQYVRERPTTYICVGRAPRPSPGVAPYRFSLSSLDHQRMETFDYCICQQAYFVGRTTANLSRNINIPHGMSLFYIRYLG